MLVQLPPAYSEEVPVKWYGAPSATEIEMACRAAINAKMDSLEESDPLVLVDEDGGACVSICCAGSTAGGAGGVRRRSSVAVLSPPVARATV